MTVGLWCGQFNIVDRGIQEEGPYVGIFEGSQAASGVNVYVVAEPVGTAGPRLCNEVLETIAAAFGQPGQALTTNLRRSLEAAHQHVRDWNRLHGREGQAGVGVSCLTARGNEAVLAQCCSALGLIQTGTRFRVASPSSEASARPLGFGDRIAPVFTPITLHAGDTILLLFQEADRLIDRLTLSHLVAAPPETAMPGLYQRVRHVPTFGALYLGAFEPAAPAPPPVRPTGTAAGPPTGMRPGDHPARTRAGRRAPPEPVIYAEDDDAGFVPPGPARGTPGRAARLNRPNSGRTAALGALGDTGRLPPPRVLLLIAAVIAVLLLLIFAAPALARIGEEDRYGALLRSAGGSITAAQGAPDASERRSRLHDAQADLLEARQIRPDASEVTDLLTQTNAELATLDATRELDGLAAVLDLSTAGIAPQSPLEMATIDGRPIVLDTTGGSLVVVDPPEGAARVLLAEGTAIDGVTVSRPRHMAVVDSPAHGRVLLVLDAERHLFAWTGDAGWRHVAVDGAGWKSVMAIAAGPEALFVLDGAAGQVWRHDGDIVSGFLDQPRPLVSHAAPGGSAGPLRDGIALSLAPDAVVATSSGRLLRLEDGNVRDVRPTALNRPLLASAAPLWDAADDVMYIAERGNQRIVLAGRDGRYDGQIRHRRFAGMRAAALDAAGGVLYTVSGQTLYEALLPR